MSLADIIPPLLFAAFVWWFSTGAILWLDRLPRATFAWTFGTMSALAIAALVALVVGAGDTSSAATYRAFACAIALWGWHEMSFLMGFILGPRRLPCPLDARGWRRFRLAAATVMHHEIALAATAAALVLLTWNQPNQIGTLTFIVLWAMRLSAKFNLFLGAAYRGEDLLPPHLQHLKSYFRDRRINPLLPLSLAGGAALAWLFASFAFGSSASLHEQAGFALLLAITLLAMVEHIFMFVPPPNALLWGWAQPRTTATPKPLSATTPAE
ncbi:MAG: hypothetical protein RIR33_2649 [Pseudomonadota bacterium]